MVAVDEWGAEQVENDREDSSEVLTGAFGASEGAQLSGNSVRPNKRPFRILSSPLSSPEKAREESENMERQETGETFGGSSDAKARAADQGAEIVAHDKSGWALGHRGESASDGAVATGEPAVGQGTEISGGGNSDAKVRTADQGGEIVEHGDSGWALGDRGEIACDGAVAAGIMVVGPGTETSGGSSDTKVGSVDQGGDIAEHGKSGRALGDCGETVSDEVVEAGEIAAGQEESGSCKGSEAPVRGELQEKPAEWDSMTPSQQRTWKMARARIRRKARG